MVASGTRKAFAISAVVSPPTARRVSAMADAGVSAGWQHMKSNISVSSLSTVSASVCACRATVCSLVRRAISLRMKSVILRVAVWISQPRGFAGTPSRGQCCAAASSAS
jgi:hypothetical protein